MELNVIFRDGLVGPTELARNEERLAIHEAGHAIAGHVVGKKINYVTILADTGSTYGKVSCIVAPGRDQSSKQIKDTIVFFLASRAAEELFIGDVYAGVYGDMNGAYNKARQLGW